MWPFSVSRTTRLRRRLTLADSFRRRLEVDRLRADRMDISIAVIAIRWDPRGSWDGRPDEDCVRAEVADLIDDHLRATDEAGGLGDDEIGVVLWNTGREGAEKFITRLHAAAPKRLKIEVTAYLYPLPDELKDDADGNELNSVAPEQSSDDADKKADKEADNTDLDEPADQDDVATPAAAAGPTGGVPTLASAPLAQTIVADEPPPSDGPSITPGGAIVFNPLAPALARSVSPVQRTIDIVGSSIGLIAAAPVLAAAALLIRLEDNGPVLFSQQRSGLGGQPFDIWKLRTMGVDAEARKAALKAESEQDGAAFKMTHDPRVTRVGHWLRKTSIDELPQLWNVLRGDMSLVGPRPLPVAEADSCDIWQRRRLDVMPGLTCIWQVEGRSRVTFVEWMRMDMQYIKRRSLWQDIRLIAATIPAVLARRGAK